jgi:hypothetical protein
MNTIVSEFELSANDRTSKESPFRPINIVTFPTIAEPQLTHGMKSNSQYIPTEPTQLNNNDLHNITMFLLEFGQCSLLLRNLGKDSFLQSGDSIELMRQRCCYEMGPVMV